MSAACLKVQKVSGKKVDLCNRCDYISLKGLKDMLKVNISLINNNKK